MPRKYPDTCRELRVERCVCGHSPVLVKTKSGYKYSCPNTFAGGCPVNIVTGWYHDAEKAAIAWNAQVSTYREKHFAKEK